MKIGIIGQGISGLFLSIFLKKKNILNDVTLIDKNVSPCRKMLATGNGRCNLANLCINETSYNSIFIKDIVEDYNASKIIAFLNEIGVFTRNFDNLVYPFSLSAKSLADYLINIAKEYKVKFINNESFLDYTVLENGKIEVVTSKKKLVFDKLVVAAGSPSAYQLGGSDTVLNIFEKHGYVIKPVKAGLTPLRTIEQTKNAENERVKAKVKLTIDKKVVYEEQGEVQFKKDGLSGIAIFNCSSMISRSSKFKKAMISLDLMPNITLEDLSTTLFKLNSISKSSMLLGIFTKTMSEYIRKASGVKNLSSFTPSEIKKIAQTIKNLEFTYKETYSLKESQVSVGGISLSEVNSNLESKKEPGIYFIGEILDADGLCGGYNIMFAIASAHKVAENLVN